MSTYLSGSYGERIAAAFLALKGYEVLDRNYRYARREIDLVARDGDTIVAVEVKTRRGSRYGRAVQAIDRRKLVRIEQALSGLMRTTAETLRVRVDVIAIDLAEGGDRMSVEHYVGVS